MSAFCRPRRGFTVALFLAVVTAVVVTAPVAAQELGSGPAVVKAPDVDTERSAHATPPPTCTRMAPTDAAGYQAMFDAKNDMTWSGGDQASSLLLPDGRTVWLFGDTMLGTQGPAGGYEPGWRMVNNSMVIQDGGCLRGLNGPLGDDLIPDPAEGEFYWPQHGVIDQGRLIVLVTRIAKTGDSLFEFEIRGVDAAVFTVPTTRDGVPTLMEVVPTPWSSAGDLGALYGQAVVSDGVHHYLYGTARVDAPLHFGSDVFVARAPVGRLLDESTWTYWDGAGWGRDPRAAERIASAASDGWSTSFSVDLALDGTFRMLTKEHGVFGTEVITGTSPSAAGPFTRAVVLGTPAYGTGGEMTYNPLAHPQSKIADGMLGAISRNMETSGGLVADADAYKPQFFTVATG